MATLVQFLAAGVNGAASGTATFLFRGTASSAASALYNDFERTAQPGTNVITLDANGAAEVYCSAYVDVVLKNSAGTTLRTVTLANSDSLVEVRSNSFLGDDYDGNPTSTAGQPLTLRTALGRWLTSAGAVDFKVLVGGVATNLQTAIAGFSGMFINVKDPAYGAVGDGVTDDTTAILAAQAAAAGGLVIFPKGTYNVTQLSLSSANCNWVGAGAGASIIRGTAGTDLLDLTDNTNTAWKNFSGLSFTTSGTYDHLINLDESQNVTFDRCFFDASNVSLSTVVSPLAAGLAKYLFTDCDFLMGTSTPSCINNNGATGTRHFSLKGCYFKAPSGFTGKFIHGADCHAEGCVFDASAVTSGVYYAVDAEDDSVTGKYVGTFTNNKFLDGGSGGFAFDLSGLSSACDFSEDSNIFIGFTAPSATLEKGHTYNITDAESGSPGDIHLGSRKGRTIHISNSAATLTASACLEAENVVVEQTGNNLVLTIPALIPGLFGRVVVFVSNGQPDRTISFVDSATVGTFLHTATINEEAMLANAGSDEVTSCSYFTTVRSDGTFRSLITSEVNHHS